MESVLAIGARSRDDAIAKAQEVMYEAWDRATSRSRIALAYKALAIDGVWILLGVIWVVVNPGAREKKLLDHTVPKRTEDSTLVGS